MAGTVLPTTVYRSKTHTFVDEDVSIVETLFLGLQVVLTEMTRQDVKIELVLRPTDIAQN
jgi:hypothetical protein